MGGSDVGGIYRVDDVDSTTLIADLANWSIDNPPDADYFVPSGVQYAFVPYGDGFLITDGHHNRLLFADLEGEVKGGLAQYGNSVPTGLQVDGSKCMWNGAASELDGAVPTSDGGISGCGERPDLEHRRTVGADRDLRGADDAGAGAV